MNKIRIAKNEDIDQVTNLIYKLHGESRYSEFPFDINKTRNFVRHVIDAGLVAINLNNNEITGAIIVIITDMYFSRAKTSSDLFFYVEPDSRNKGIGTNLIKYYIAWAKIRKIDDISLSSSTGIAESAMKKVAKKYNMQKVGVNYKVINHV